MTRAALLLCFALGEIAQLSIQSARAGDRVMTRWCWAGLPLLIAVIVAVGLLESAGGALSLTAAALLIYPMIFGAADLMPEIDESYVLGSTAAGWCAAAVFLAPRAEDLPALPGLLWRWPLATAALAAGTLFAVLPVMVSLRPGRALKLAYYVWFVLVVLASAGLEWQAMPLGYLSGGPYPMTGAAGALTAFAGGMATTFLLSHFAFLVFLGSVWKRRDKEGLKAHRALFDKVSRKFAGRRLPLADALLIVGANLAALVFHYATGSWGPLIAGGLLASTPVLHARLPTSPRAIGKIPG